MPYTISLCERSVKRGQKLDVKVLGKPLSHPFLVLKDFKGRVVSELHGSWSPTFCRKQVALSKFLELFVAGAAVVNQDLKVHRVFNQLNLPHRPVNTMYVYSGVHQYQDAEYEEVLRRGSCDELKACWERGSAFSQYISDLKLPYTRYAHGTGINCQKTLKATMDVAIIGCANDVELNLGSAGWSYGDSIVGLSQPKKLFIS